MIIECLKNTSNQHVDVIIATVPWTDSSIPLMAPAVLRPVVEKTGHSCLAIDLNAEICMKISTLQDPSLYLEFFFHGVCKTELSQNNIYEILLSISEQMVSWKPKFIGLSLFSYVCRHSAFWLCYTIKKLDPTVQIILGGAGCLEQFTGPAFFAKDLIDKKLADYHVRGDGEHALHALLTGDDSHPGINDNSWKQLDNNELASLPIPDYSDYDFSIYQKPMLPLQGSRGCVRKCTFCDYIANWTIFRWRTADDIFNEMQTQYRKYGIRTFKFQDTLTNGNIKEFNRLIEILSDYNTKNPEQSFRWGGYYIFRERSNRDDDHWKMIKQSGADFLTVGIENLNEDIRYAIGKKFSNASIDYHLEQALKHDVRLQLLFIVGYITETQEHIDFAKQWLADHVRYQPIISLIQWGGGLGIFPNTWLDANKNNLNIKITGSQPYQWENPHTGNNHATRARWIGELARFSQDLGYVIADDIDNHFLLEQMINAV